MKGKEEALALQDDAITPLGHGITICMILFGKNVKNLTNSLSKISDRITIR